MLIVDPVIVVQMRGDDVIEHEVELSVLQRDGVVRPADADLNNLTINNNLDIEQNLEEIAKQIVKKYYKGGLK